MRPTAAPDAVTDPGRRVCTPGRVVDRENEILQHSLGIDRVTRVPWRNYYCAEDGASDLEALVSAGLMERGRTINDERDRIYIVTTEGTKRAVAALPKPLSRGQLRYRRYLDAKDAYPDMTFRQFLERLREEAHG